MIEHQITLVEAPTNLGLKQPEYGGEPGVRFLPEAISEAGFENLVRIREKLRLEPPAYSVEINPESRVRNADAIIAYSRQVANVIERFIRQNRPLLVCGRISCVIEAADKINLYGFQILSIF